MTMSPCGASRSWSWELGVRPIRLRRKIDRTTARFPLALVPSYPTALRSAVLSVTTASQGLHWPM